jgi:hypothetical protein
MYVRGYLQGSENGRVVTIELSLWCIVNRRLYFILFLLAILLSVHFQFTASCILFLVIARDKKITNITLAMLRQHTRNV